MTGHHPDFDVELITECFARHGVEYLLVGGFGAQLHGATRPTGDIDALASWSEENLERIVVALRELNARLRVHGMSDDESTALPSMLFIDTLRQMEISTWRTDAGDIDILADPRAPDGERRRYERLAARASRADVGGVVVGVAALSDIIDAKTSRTATRTETPYRSCDGLPTDAVEPALLDLTTGLPGSLAGGPTATTRRHRSPGDIERSPAHRRADTSQVTGRPGSSVSAHLAASPVSF